MARGDDRLTDQERGQQSKEGWDENDRSRPQKDSPVDPNLAPPAENDKGPGRDDGLGQPEGVEPDPDRPVPSGDPYTESDRSDIQ
jgi:hypothetical protein